MFVLRSSVVVLVLVVALAAGSVSADTGELAGVRAQTSSTPEQLCAAADLAEPASREFEQAEDVLKEGVDYWAVLCTDAGPIYIDLYEDAAPMTVNNFVFLAQQNYYNNTTFHRVLPGFMAQGGDPTGTGSGGPGYEFGDETDNGKLFDQAGLLAMANAGPGTNGSQFFVTYAETPWLDGNHTIFGEVYQGIETVERLTPRDPQQMPVSEGAALNTVLIVEDPANVVATPDGPPSLDHLQYLLETVVVSEINPIFAMDTEYSHVYDLAAEAESYGVDGGEALTAYLSDYLAAHNFEGTAAVVLPLSECPESPEILPIWLLGFQIADYGVDATAVVEDEDRAAQFIETGAVDATVIPEGVNGRIFTTATDPDQWCGPDGTYYRLEFPYGRYILMVDLVLDNTQINETTEQRPMDFLMGIMQDFMLGSLAGPLDRGNAAVE